SWSSPRSSVDRLPATPARPHRGPVVEALAADPGRRVAAVAHDHDVREIDGGFLLHHTAGLLLVPRLLVTLHHVEALDDDAVLLADHAQHLAGLPLFPPRDDHHGVDLLEALRAQLARDRAEDAGPDRLTLIVDEHRRVVVESDVRTVGAADLLGRPHDHRLHHVALLHLGVGDCLLDGDHDDVTERRVAPLRPTQHLDAQHLAGAGVVGH